MMILIAIAGNNDDHYKFLFTPILVPKVPGTMFLLNTSIANEKVSCQSYLQSTMFLQLMRGFSCAIGVYLPCSFLAKNAL